MKILQKTVKKRPFSILQCILVDKHTHMRIRGIIARCQVRLCRIISIVLMIFLLVQNRILGRTVFIQRVTKTPFNSWEVFILFVRLLVF